MSEQNADELEDNRSVNRDKLDLLEEGGENKKLKATEEECGKRYSRVERLIVISLALTVYRIKYKAGVESATEIINILHHNNFVLDVFKDMVKSIDECANISQDVINRCKEETSQSSDDARRAPS